MPLRQLQVFLPVEAAERLDEALEDLQVIPLCKSVDEPEWGLMALLVVDAYKAEPIMQELQARFSELDHFRMALFEAVAIHPHPEDADSDPPAERDQEEAQEPDPSRVAIEELEEQLRRNCTLDRNFIVTVLLSAVVAAVGLVKDNTAVVIGAMVIAPLLGPNMALSLGTTLGKIPLIRRALATNAVGVIVALAFSVLVGVLLTVDPSSGELSARTSVGYADLVLALAAGAAGALAFTTGVPVALVGVMVAVALLPPLVACGILAGAGEFRLAYSAGLLTVANVIAVNLSAVVTFALKKVRPRHYWEAGKARRMFWVSTGIWLILLALLALIIWMEQPAA